MATQKIGELVIASEWPIEDADGGYSLRRTVGYVTEAFKIVIGTLPGYAVCNPLFVPLEVEDVAQMWATITTVPALFSAAVVAYPAREDHGPGVEKVVVIEGTLVERDMAAGCGSDDWRTKVIKAALDLQKKLGQKVVRVDFHDSVTVPLRS